MESRESVLVIVLAETRNWELTFDWLKSHCLEVLGADLALCVADNSFEDTSNPFYREARHVWKGREWEDWGEAFDEAQAVEGWSADWRVLRRHQGNWLGGVREASGETRWGSSAILLYYRWVLKRRLLESGVLDQYDRFVLTRSDFMHEVPHLPLWYLQSKYTWLPDGEDYGGYTDRHLVANGEDFLRALSVTDLMLREPERLDRMMGQKRHWNLEGFLKLAFQDIGLDQKIRRFPYTMYAAKLPGGRSRWSAGVYAGYRGFFIKYWSEYRRYLIFRNFVSRPGDWTEAAILRAEGLARVSAITDLWIRYAYRIFGHDRVKWFTINGCVYLYRFVLIPIWLLISRLWPMGEAKRREILRSRGYQLSNTGS